MKAIQTKFDGVLLLEPEVYRDERGHFMEVWRRDRYRELGIEERFVQDNVSFSWKGVLRGLHFQHPEAQGKLVTCLHGEVYDVIVDIRENSATYGEWLGCRLSLASGRQLYIPPGFAHGFVVTSDSASFLYKCTRFYNPAGQFSLRWNDPAIGVEWPVKDPVISDKDREAPFLAELKKKINATRSGS
jgi:dTDP-4-dehydrorhamnose 3,5-epimerase